jgi:hypothetical protein
MRYRALASGILLIVTFPWAVGHVCRAATVRAVALAHPETAALSPVTGFTAPPGIVWADGGRE